MTAYPAYLSTTAPFLNPAQPIIPYQADDTVGCEICGLMVLFPTIQAMVTNAMMTGSYTMPPFQCNAVEHYACCMEHLVVAQALCLFEHMTQDGQYVGKGTAFSAAYDTLYAAFGTYVAALRTPPASPPTS
jgi:hypothetical protein